MLDVQLRLGHLPAGPGAGRAADQRDQGNSAVGARHCRSRRAFLALHQAGPYRSAACGGAGIGAAWPRPRSAPGTCWAASWPRAATWRCRSCSAMEIDPGQALQRELQRRSPDGPATTPPTGTDGPGPGFSDTAVAALQLTITEAAALGHNYIGCEHLLLGLIGEPGRAGRPHSARPWRRTPAYQAVCYRCASRLRPSEHAARRRSGRCPGHRERARRGDPPGAGAADAAGGAT